MDVSVMINDFKFNYRVAAIIKHNHKILLHKNKQEDFYAIPGGRIKIGEDSITALKREFFEEMRADINVNKMIGIVENFFEYNNKKNHEIMLIYDVEFNTNTKFYDTEVIKGIEDNENLEFIWKKISDIKELDVKPNRVKELIVDNQKEFLHIVNKYD